MVPGALSGESYAPTLGNPPMSAGGGGGGGSGATQRHYQEVLKAEGVDPAATYQTFYKPLPYWPHVVKNNEAQIPGIDFTFDEETFTLTILEDMDLIDTDLLWVRYDYSGLVGDPLIPLLYGPIGYSEFDASPGFYVADVENPMLVPVSDTKFILVANDYQNVPLEIIVKLFEITPDAINELDSTEIAGNDVIWPNAITFINDCLIVLDGSGTAIRTWPINDTSFGTLVSQDIDAMVTPDVIDFNTTVTNIPGTTDEVIITYRASSQQYYTRMSVDSSGVTLLDDFGAAPFTWYPNNIVTNTGGYVLFGRDNFAEAYILDMTTPASPDWGSVFDPAYLAEGVWAWEPTPASDRFDLISVIEHTGTTIDSIDDDELDFWYWFSNTASLARTYAGNGDLVTIGILFPDDTLVIKNMVTNAVYDIGAWTDRFDPVGNDYDFSGMRVGITVGDYFVVAASSVDFVASQTDPDDPYWALWIAAIPQELVV